MKPIDEYTEQLISGLEELWRQVLPDLETPFRSRLRSWLEIGPFETIEYAIQRTCRKAWMAARQGNAMNAGQCRAYCENVLKNEVERQQAAEGQDGWSVSHEEGSSHAS